MTPIISSVPDPSGGDAGNTIQAHGEKIDEQLFEATDVSVQ